MCAPALAAGGWLANTTETTNWFPSCLPLVLYRSFFWRSVANRWAVTLLLPSQTHTSINYKVNLEWLNSCQPLMSVINSHCWYNGIWRSPGIQMKIKCCNELKKCPLFTQSVRVSVNGVFLSDLFSHCNSFNLLIWTLTALNRQKGFPTGTEFIFSYISCNGYIWVFYNAGCLCHGFLEWR